MSKVRYEVRVKTGERDGKTYYSTVGRVLQGDKGFSLKMDAIPVAWDGWAFLSEPKPKEGTAKQTTSKNSFDDDWQP